MRHLLVLLFVGLLGLGIVPFATGTLVNVPGGLWLPMPPPSVVGGPVFTTHTAMTASTHAVATVFRAPATCTIDSIGLRTGTVATFSGGDSLGVGLYTVDASGNATSTAYGGMTAGTQASVASNTYYTVALSPGATATAGDLIAAKIFYSAFNTASTQISLLGGNTEGRGASFPYGEYYNGAAWTKVAYYPVLSVGCGGTYYPINGVYPITTVAGQTFNVNTAGTDEYGMAFTLTGPMRLAGVAAYQTATSGDFEIDLYSGTSTTAAYTYTAQGTAISGVAGTSYFALPTPQVLSAAAYKVSYRPTTATSTGFYMLTFPSAATLDQMPGGQAWRLCTRINQGTWDADTTTKRPMLYLQFDQIDNGAGGGGGGTRSYAIQ